MPGNRIRPKETSSLRKKLIQGITNLRCARFGCSVFPTRLTGSVRLMDMELFGGAGEAGSKVEEFGGCSLRAGRFGRIAVYSNLLLNAGVVRNVS
jgi:hypothetical protein